MSYAVKRNAFSDFFIRRPIFACVLALVILIAGVVSFPQLPVAQYPDITPPVIRVTASFPGASAQVVADSVAAPIEQQVNGVAGMLFMESTSADDGSYTLDVTFDLGTNADIAAVLVQNRVEVAMPQLPEDVRRHGVVTNKVSTSIVSVFALAPVDPGTTPQFDELYLANYLVIHVNDRVKRIAGIGDTLIRPGKDYGMRVWLDPDRLRARGLTTVDVVAALREQNVPVAAGVIGAPPSPGDGSQLSVATVGRLQTPEQFEDIVVRSEGDRLVRLEDVARVELGARAYDTLGRVDGVPAALMVVYGAVGGNSVEVAAELNGLLEEMARDLPAGLEFREIYDASDFVNAAIGDVFRTVLIATALVALVVFVFLGSLRSTLIPIAVIPVALLGTLFALRVFGFGLNLPVLFGLVLAVGLVVDDAVVVVDYIERNLTERRMPPREAASRAMAEVLVPVVCIALVLMAVFVPTAVLPGIAGQIYRQFALTIATATFFSAVCTLSLSPALTGYLLRPAKPGRRRVFKDAFDRAFAAIAAAHARFVRVLVRPGVIGIALVAFGAVCYLTWWSVTRVPTGFIPDEDRGLIVAEVRLPASASQERTLAVLEDVEQILADTEGIAHVGSVQGFSLVEGNGSNNGVVFAGLEPWPSRIPRGRTLAVILEELQAEFWQIQEGSVQASFPPAIEGIGDLAGFELRLEDRGGVGRERLQQFVEELVVDGNSQSQLRAVDSAYRAGEPQILADLDRDKAKTLGLSLVDVFSTLSVNLGSAYVNDVNMFGRTWPVNVQAEGRFRASADQIGRLQVRNSAGAMIPLGSVMRLEETIGPDRVLRYNLYPAAAITGSSAPAVSSGAALALVEDMLEQKRPRGIGFEWTGLAFQERLAARTAFVAFGLALVVVYLILAALYESWAMPLAVVLSIPLAVLGAMLGLMSRGLPNDVYTQVGLVLLVGLGARNSILLVSVAMRNRERGLTIVDAVVEAARQRLRPILMTALGVILAVLPLVYATGAGAASSAAIGTTVFYGMIGNTLLGLIFVPVLYVTFAAISERVSRGGPRHVEPRGA